MTHITVSGREGTCIQQEPLTSGSAGIRFRFTFDRAWEGLTRIVVFRGSGRCVDLVLPESGELPVPSEVLSRDGGTLYVGVYGTDGSGALIIPTVWIPAGQIWTGVLPSGIGPGAITPPLAEQVITDADRARRRAEAAARRAETASDSAQQAASEAMEYKNQAAAQADEAERFALQARLTVENRSWIWFSIDSDGDAVFHRTEDVDDLGFRIDEEGSLVAQYG